jgi:hypothetical protein
MSLLPTSSIVFIFKGLRGMALSRSASIAFTIDQSRARDRTSKVRPKIKGHDADLMMMMMTMMMITWQLEQTVPFHWATALDRSITFNSAISPNCAK